MFRQISLNVDSEDSQRQTILKLPLPKKYVFSKTKPINQKQLNSNNKNGGSKKAPQSPEYFTNILKQQKKKMYVNTFLKKLRYSIVLQNPPQSDFLLQQNNQAQQQDQFQIRIPKIVELILLFLWCIQGLFLLILNSVALIFTEINHSQTFKSLMVMSMVFHLFEVFIKFFIHFNYEENKLTKIKQITCKYLEYDFWLDLIIFMSMMLYLILRDIHSISILFQLLIFLKADSIFYIIRHLQITLIENVYRQQIYSLIKVFLFNFSFAHILALALLLMAGLDAQHNWMINKGFDSLEWDQKYIWAYYWATTIMLTVGFGDIVPSTSKQALCMIFIETMSCILLAYNINQVGNIISKIRSYESQKISNLKIFNHINQKSQFSEQTRTRIMNYIKESTEMRINFNINEEKQFIKSLPNSFKSDILKQMNRHIWNGMKFFQNLSEETLVQLSIAIEKKLAHPEEIVYKKGSDINIIVFNGGGFGYSYNNGNSMHNGKLIQHFKVPEDSYQIASLDFLFGDKLNFDIKSTDYCIYYVLSAGEMIKILKNNSYDSEYYFMIKDKDKFILNQHQIPDCQVCSKQKHSAFKCPRLHYIPLKDHIIRKYKEKYLPALCNYGEGRKQKKSYKVLSSYSLNRKKFIEAKIFVSNFFQVKTRTDIETNSFGSGIESNNEIGELMKTLHHIDIIGERGRISTHKNNNKFYEEAMNEIKNKLDYMMYKPKFQWDVESDVAYNFKFYFRKNNPDEISSFLNKKGKLQVPRFNEQRPQKTIFGYKARKSIMNTLETRFSPLGRQATLR